MPTRRGNAQIGAAGSGAITDFTKLNVQITRNWLVPLLAGDYDPSGIVQLRGVRRAVPLAEELVL
jgi:hypothetical protein